MGKFSGDGFAGGLLGLGLLAGGLPLAYGGLILGTKAYVETLDAVVSTPTEFILKTIGADPQTAENIGVDAGIVTGILLPLVAYWWFFGRGRAQE